MIPVPRVATWSLPPVSTWSPCPALLPDSCSQCQYLFQYICHFLIPALIICVHVSLPNHILWVPAQFPLVLMICVLHLSSWYVFPGLLPDPCFLAHSPVSCHVAFWILISHITPCDSCPSELLPCATFVGFLNPCAFLSSLNCVACPSVLQALLPKLCAAPNVHHTCFVLQEELQNN